MAILYSSSRDSNHRGSRDLPTQPTLDGVRGRKAFYGPDVSYLGTTWTDDPILYFGTGDRAHPRYVNWDGTNGFHERYYAVTDDADATTAADETNLLNLTCDELETFGDVNQDGTVDAGDNPLRTALRDILFGINTEGRIG